MNHNLFTTLLSLAVCTALLIVGAMAASRASGTSGRLGAVDAPVVTDIEAAEEGGTDQPRQKRRNRAALSMPYFSFAQSLRPRG